MKRIIKNKRGSVIIVLIMVITVITSLGLTALSITMSHFQIKKSYSESKKAFYVSEGGLNNAYAKAYDLVCESATLSLNKANEYLTEKPGDLSGASNIFCNYYKQNIIGMLNIKVKSISNLQVSVLNNSSLIFINEKLKARIISKYVSETGIEKITAADIIISVPDYFKTKDGMTDFSSLLIINNFDL